jgi:hypothetical protein
MLDLLLGDEGDGERVGNAFSDSNEKSPVHVDAGQHVLGLLPTPSAVKPGLCEKY